VDSRESSLALRNPLADCPASYAPCLLGSEAPNKHIRVLSGSVLANLPDRIVMLEVFDSLHVPAVFAHALTPLSPDAKLSILFVPSLDVFAS